MEATRLTPNYRTRSCRYGIYQIGVILRIDHRPVHHRHPFHLEASKCLAFVMLGYCIVSSYVTRFECVGINMSSKNADMAVE
jgi:hypothetical protein